MGWTVEQQKLKKGREDEENIYNQANENRRL